MNSDGIDRRQFLSSLGVLTTAWLFTGSKCPQGETVPPRSEVIFSRQQITDHFRITGVSCESNGNVVYTTNSNPPLLRGTTKLCKDRAYGVGNALHPNGTHQVIRFVANPKRPQTEFLGKGTALACNRSGEVLFSSPDGQLIALDRSNVRRTLPFPTPDALFVQATLLDSGEVVALFTHSPSGGRVLDRIPVLVGYQPSGIVRDLTELLQATSCDFQHIPDFFNFMDSNGQYVACAYMQSGNTFGTNSWKVVRLHLG